MRITINEDEFALIVDALKKYSHTGLLQKLLKQQSLEKERSKQQATRTTQANDAKKKASREKIQNAINLLRIENKPITLYSVAKMANISYATIKRHIPKSLLESIDSNRL